MSTYKAASRRIMLRRNAALPAIGRLFFFGRPFAIGRLVIAIIVDAIDRMTWRRSPTNIGQKGQEAIAPSGANLNPPSAIIWKVMYFIVVTTVTNINPSSIFWRAVNAVRFAVVFHNYPPLAESNING